MEWLIYGVKEKDGINLWSKGEGWNESREKEKSKDKEEREYKEGKEREWNQKSANKTEEGRGSDNKMGVWEVWGVKKFRTTGRGGLRVKGTECGGG